MDIIAQSLQVLNAQKQGLLKLDRLTLRSMEGLGWGFINQLHEHGSCPLCRHPDMHFSPSDISHVSILPNISVRTIVAETAAFLL